MSLFERIKKLSDKRGISIQKLSSDLGFSDNLIYQWKNSSPKADRLQKVADYFHVSVDYLLGRDEQEPKVYTEKDIDKIIDNGMSYDGKEVGIEDREILR
ncbi:MAG: helix-turn-helix domain-containing protein, partial [Streptococcaceae bacterium]|nr:helix-turn-helix domain-containing protein [Streptococcaceae bacterium]